MKTITILILLLLVLPSCVAIAQEQIVTDSATQSHTQKLKYYESEMKNKTVAVVLAFIPSAGHAYAGNWGRGLLFAAGELGGIVLAFSAGIEGSRSLGQINDWYWIGLWTAVGIRGWEFFDAAAEVDRYNDALYKKIVGKKSYGLNIIPTKNGLLLHFTYIF